jgi:phosphate/sulfate permease
MYLEKNIKLNKNNMKNIIPRIIIYMIAGFAAAFLYLYLKKLIMNKNTERPDAGMKSANHQSLNQK